MTIRLWGQQQRVNVTTTGTQSSPAITVLTNGNLVLVWHDFSSGAGEIRSRIYDAAGVPVTGEMTVAASALAELDPAVTATADGGYTVAFRSGANVNFSNYTASGGLLNSGQNFPNATDVALATSGTGHGFVDVFVFNSEIYVDRATAAGALSGAITVNTTTAGTQSLPDVARLSDGRYAIVWNDADTAVRARVMNADGTFSGADFVVNTSATSFPEPRVTALQNGAFLVTFGGSGGGYPASGTDVRGRIVDGTGALVGASDFIVNSVTAGNQFRSDAVGLPGGGFLVVWHQLVGEVRAQKFDAFGARVGDEILVEQFDSASSSLRSISAVLMADGRVAVTWRTNGFAGDSDAAVALQILDPRDGFVSGTDLADVLYGGDFADQVVAGAGNDTVFAGFGDDIVLGGPGNDSVDGGAGGDILGGQDGADVLAGAAGDDLLYGGVGNDTLSGGSGSDTISYADATNAVNVALYLGSTATFGSGLDTFISIENVIGSNFADYILGDAGANILLGGGNNDRLEGREGADSLDGEAGDDLLYGGLGDDVLNGGDGNDTVSYADAPSAVNVALYLGSTQTFGGGLDTFLGVENVVGSAFGDYLLGDAAANRLAGGDGDDQLDGRQAADLLEGGEGNDILIGGEGADLLLGGNGADRFVFVSGADSVSIARDRIFDFNIAVDLIDLSAMDADSVAAGDQAFTLVSSFTGVRGQATLAPDGGTGNTILTLDFNGDGVGDFFLYINGLQNGSSGFVF